jgi:PAS domain S-box-containing protein
LVGRWPRELRDLREPEARLRQRRRASWFVTSFDAVAPGRTEELISELRKSEELFRTICENAPVMIDQFDDAGHCRLWNRECERQLGYTLAEIEACDDPLALFYPDPADRERVLERLTRADGEFREYRVRAKDQSFRTQMWADFRLPDGSLISVGHDVSDQRATEGQLRQSQKMEALGQLTGGMAHDFNNLLTIVLANAEVLERELGASSALVQTSVREIIAAAGRGASLIRKLLAFGRNQMLALQPLHATALVNELAPAFARLLPDAIRVRVEADATIPAIRADQGAVEQILMNLVTNARDAMQGAGVLGLLIERRWVEPAQARRLHCQPGEYVAIVVRDDGVGMDDVTRARMFEPFFTTKKGAGTGLGMPMVFGLMAQQGGAVTVESTPGEGTEVALMFQVEATASARPELASSGGRKILVVEDEAALRRVTTTILSQEGYEVETMPDGLYALERLRGEHQIDLVLCDLTMPRMSGVQLFEALDPNTRPSFLFVTGHPTDEAMAKIRRDETVQILQKPYKVDQLLSAIGAILAAQDEAVAG